MTTAVISNNTGADYSGTEDCGIESVNSPETNKGSAIENQVFSWGSGSPDDLGHILIKFSGLSNITGPVTVSSATLSLYLGNATSSTSKDIDIFELLRPWTEAGATWATYDGTNNWTTAGGTGSGDADMGSALATTSVGATGVYYDWSSAALAALVQDWINTPASNYGVLMRRNPWNAYDAHTKQFRTKNDSSDITRPKLTIEYTAGTPQTAAPTATVAAGSWTYSTGSTLYGTVDETTADNADYDYTTTASDTMKLRFGSVTDPAVGTGHKVKYRISATASDQITVALYDSDGTTLIATDTARAPGSTPTDYTLTLSEAQANSITSGGYSTGLVAAITSGTHAGATSTAAQLPTTTSTASETGYADQDFVNWSRVTADDTSYSTITHPAYDTGTESYVGYAKGFDFSEIPDGSTITGVECIVCAWYDAGTASGVLAQLCDATGARGGTNMWATPAALSGTTGATLTVGGSGQTWGNSLTAAWVKDADFGVAVAFRATSNNTDISVDYITLKIYYTPPAADFRLQWLQLEVPEAPAGDVTRAPAQAAATITGLQPGLFRQYFRQPAQGAATLTGLAPSVVVNTIKQPAQGTAAFTGLAPGLFRQYFRQPAQAALTATGLAPDLFREFYRQPAQGAGTFTGLAPEALVSVLRYPAEGTAAFTGLAPSLLTNNIREPAQGEIVAAGLAPALLENIFREPAQVAAAFTGHEPTVTEQAGVTDYPIPVENAAATFAGLAPDSVIDLIAQPGAGEVTTAGLQPALLSESFVQPSQAAAVFSGLAPSLLTNEITEPAQAAATFAGAAPAPLQNTIREPAQAAVVSSGAAPSLFSEFYITPDVAVVTFTGAAPILAAEGILQPDQAAATFSGYAPALTWELFRQPAQAEATFAGLAPSLTYELFRQPAQAAVTFAGLEPTVSSSDQKIAQPGSTEAVFSGYAPVAAGSEQQIAAPDAAAISFTGNAPSVVTDRLLTPEEAAATFGVYAPSVQQSVIVKPAAAALAFTGRAPVHSVSSVERPANAALSFVGRAPDIARTGENIFNIAPAEIVFSGLAPIVPTILASTPATRKTRNARSVVSTRSVEMPSRHGNVSESRRA